MGALGNSHVPAMGVSGVWWASVVSSLVTCTRYSLMVLNADYGCCSRDAIERHQTEASYRYALIDGDDGSTFASSSVVPSPIKVANGDEPSKDPLISRDDASVASISTC